MKFKDRLFVKKAMKLMKEANKRGLNTEWDIMKCKSINVYAFDDRVRFRGQDDSCLEIKL